MAFLGRWEIDDTLVFPANTHSVATGAATDADSVPVYKIYEDETGTAILTGSMAKLDDAGTTGFYSEQITLSAANGFEVGKCYTIYVSATVNSVTGTMAYTFQVEAALSTLTPAGIRTAVGLATANLDTQLDALPTNAELATALGTADDATLAAIAGISVSGATPAELWTYANRSLTQPSAQVQAAITGSDLAIVTGVTFSATLTGLDIGPTWSKCYFTIKSTSRLSKPDTQADLQILATNGGAAGDGLLYLDGAPATASQASLVVNQGAGTVAITIADEATAELVARSYKYEYDLKIIMADGSSVLLTGGTVTVSNTPTATITSAAIVSLPAQLIWNETHEVNDATKLYGRMSQWYVGQSSPDQDSAEAGTTATRPSGGAVLSQHHTGNYAMRTNIQPTATGTAGCRTNYSILAETYPFGDFYYGAWYYQPSIVTVGNFWQNWQWKVRNMALSTAPYVAYALYVYNPAPGYMAYRLTYKLGEDAGIPGPHAGGVTVAYSEDSSVLIPVAEWYHLEGYIKPAYDYTGQVIIRMNGVEIFNWQNVITMDQQADRCNPWHITNYGRNLGLGSTLGSGNSTITLYNDDETIGIYDWIYGSPVQPW